MTGLSSAAATIVHDQRQPASRYSELIAIIPTIAILYWKIDEPA
jgi:hypothetical protein